jgi:hypothetical protein
MGIRNLWTLNVDELLVADQLKANFKKSDYDVFYPLNSQMKNIDLVFMNVKTAKAKTIQVKGSRTYVPRKSEVERFGEGSAAWFKIGSESIFEPTNKVDYFVFVLHSFEDGEIKKEIVLNYLVIPTKDFQAICKKKKGRSDGNSYDFFIWIDSKGNRSFDFRGSNILPLSKYLNNWSLISV